MESLNEYQDFANDVAMGYNYEELKYRSAEHSHELIYNIMGLSGEAGEALEKIKKAIRNSNMDKAYDHLIEHSKITDIALELGDALFYIARAANLMGYTLQEIAKLNQTKLKDRLERGVVKGEGDHR